MANLENQNKANLRYLINELDKQLISYRVTDSNGAVRGTVADIYRDSQNNLQLLVALSDRASDSDWYQLTYRNIYEINLETQTVVTNLSLKQISELPLYQPLPPALQTAVADAATGTDTLSNRSISAASTVEQPETTETKSIPLLEEKLTVKRYKRKVGEIVVRKEIETRMVQIPIKSEKLVVERIGVKPEVLTEVELGTETVNITNSPELATSFKSKFVSIETAIKILQVLNQENRTSAKIRLEMITSDKVQRDVYRAICDRIS